MKKWFFMMLCAVILAGCTNKFTAKINYEIEDFQATDQHGEPFTLADTKGKPWLALFMFTNCTTICSPMTYNMSQVQQALVDEGIEDYQIVAFSVDPATDTPQVLTDYFSFYDVADESKWHFVTGYDQKFIEQFAATSFQTIVKLPSGTDQVVHSNRFYLVDQEGIAVNYYDGYTSEGDIAVADIVADMQALLKK